MPDPNAVITLPAGKWNYLSIPKLQPLHRWVGKWKKFHPILYLTCDYLSMLGLKSIHVSSKRGRNRHLKGRKVGLISTNLFLIIDGFVLYSLSWRRHTKWRTGCGDFLQYLQYNFLGQISTAVHRKHQDYVYGKREYSVAWQIKALFETWKYCKQNQRIILLWYIKTYANAYL